MPEIKPAEYLVARRWNDRKAEWEYSLYKVTYESKETWICSGNREWAVKTADHYNIEFNQ